MTEPKEALTLGWYLKRIIKTLKYEGLSRLLLRTAAYIGYRSGVWLVGWYVRPISEAIDSIELKLPVEFKELTLADSDNYLACDSALSASEFKQRIASGVRCYSACHKGHVVSVSWVADGRVWIDFFSRNFSLKNNEIYLFGSYTESSYRGKHIQSALLMDVLQRYRDLDYQYACVIIAPENRGNISSRLRSGFKRTAWVVAINIIRFRWDSMKSR